MVEPIVKANSSDEIEKRVKEIMTIKKWGDFNNNAPKTAPFNEAYNSLWNKKVGNPVIDEEFLAEPIADARIRMLSIKDTPQVEELVRQELYRQQAAGEFESVSTQVLPTEETPPQPVLSPFDLRLSRLSLDGGEARLVIPYNFEERQVSTSGYIASNDVVKDSKIKEADSIIQGMNDEKASMGKESFYQGVPSLINSYAITRLYGSEGGKYLINKKGERKWYEVDISNDSLLNISAIPTTSALISWGNGDPYGRTPYHFSDFVFCKWWNRVPNNRLITLRRFAAPIIDNMKFPGMDGFVDQGAEGAVDNKEGSGGKESGNPEGGSGRRVNFPPMATAVTFFGEETENTLASILNFTTGLNWDEATSDVWTATSQENPDVEAGPGGGKLFGGLGKYAKMLNIATGNFNSQAILNNGQLPPDPYSNGPYDHKIIGPVNVIDRVKKRSRGLVYTNSIKIVFEYVARPIGGINTKAALLDILGNFLLIGSASAMFWGGQHRFMGQPQKYPFMGGDKGIQQWYRGNPIGWAKTSMESFYAKGSDGVSKSGDFFKQFLGALTGGGDFLSKIGNVGDLLGGDNIAGNAIRGFAAERSSGQIPFLTGLKSLLIGEPVGEWHVTVGNPLNPIAMIGNLICQSIEVQFGEELGPDDFPLELKVTVNLEHGMPRDRDAIESIFNRGMGRFYDLPDSFKGSADFESRVTNNTGDQSVTGSKPTYAGGTVVADSTTTGGKFSPPAIKENSMGGSVSVWNRTKFNVLSPDQPLFGADPNNSDGNLQSFLETRSAYRSADWVRLRALK